MESSKNQIAVYWMTAGILLVLAIFFLWNVLVLAWAVNPALAIGVGSVLLVGTQVLVTTR